MTACWRSSPVSMYRLVSVSVNLPGGAAPGRRSLGLPGWAAGWKMTAHEDLLSQDLTGFRGRKPKIRVALSTPASRQGDSLVRPLVRMDDAWWASARDRVTDVKGVPPAQIARRELLRARSGLAKVLPPSIEEERSAGVHPRKTAPESTRRAPTKRVTVQRPAPSSAEQAVYGQLL
jgi:hypothetical protein